MQIVTLFYFALIQFFHLFIKLFCCRSKIPMCYVLHVHGQRGQHEKKCIVVYCLVNISNVWKKLPITSYQEFQRIMYSLPMVNADIMRKRASSFAVVPIIQTCEKGHRAWVILKRIHIQGRDNFFVKTGKFAKIIILEVLLIPNNLELLLF